MKTVLWKIFENGINLYQGFVQIYFIYKFMLSTAKKHIKMLTIVFSVVLGTAITILNALTIYEGLASSLYILILFLYALLSFKDRLIKKIFASIIPFVVVLLVTTVELNMISSIYGVSIKDIITEQNAKRLICLFIIQVSIFLCLFATLEFFKYSDEYSISDWLPVVITLVASFLLCSLLHAISLSANEDQRLYINSAYIVILLLNYLIFYVIQSIFRKNKEINEMKIFRLREQHMEQFIENANAQYESIRKIRHDIKDQLLAVHELLVVTLHFRTHIQNEPYIGKYR